MLRRAGDLTARARERIRAAREHDPHAWDHDPVLLLREDDPEPIDVVQIPEDDADDGATRPRWGARSRALPTSRPPGRTVSAARRWVAARTGPGSAPGG